jgi:hypothetical protein
MDVATSCRDRDSAFSLTVGISTSELVEQHQWDVGKRGVLDPIARAARRVRLAPPATTATVRDSHVSSIKSMRAARQTHELGRRDRFA